MVKGHDPDADGARSADSAPDPAPAPVARFDDIGTTPAGRAPEAPAPQVDGFETAGSDEPAQVASFDELVAEAPAAVTELSELDAEPAGTPLPVAGFADLGASRPELPRVVRLSELSAPAGRGRERRSGPDEGERPRRRERSGEPRKPRARRAAREAAPGPGFGPGPDEVLRDPDELWSGRPGVGGEDAPGHGTAGYGAAIGGAAGQGAAGDGAAGEGAGGEGAGGEGAAAQEAGEESAGADGAGGQGGAAAKGRRARRGWGQPTELPPGTDPVAAAKEICLRLLSDRARTRQELAQALRRKGVPDDAAGSVLERFDEVGLIDDAAFAGQWVRSRHAYKGLARRAIAVELRRKGVDDEVAGAALAEVDPESEEQRAEELVRRKLRTLTVETPEQKASATRRLVGMLARKGYGAGTAYRVVKEALAQHGVELDELGEAEPGD